jgi:hypothetical protein
MLETIFALITSMTVATCGLHMKCRHFTFSLGYLSIVGLDEVWDSHELVSEVTSCPLLGWISMSIVYWGAWWTYTST